MQPNTDKAVLNHPFFALHVYGPNGDRDQIIIGSEAAVSLNTFADRCSDTSVKGPGRTRTWSFDVIHSCTISQESLEMSQTAAALPLSPKVRKRQSRTRQRILDESAHLFIAKGFENVSVEDIIEAAEIARSSFYRFFSNREQVLTNIIRPVFEQGVVELETISTNDPFEIMSGIFDTYLKLWNSSPDALRVSTRIGGVYFYLFEDIHAVFRGRLASMLYSIESSGIFINGSADYTGRLLARTAVNVLEVYSQETDIAELFHKTMTGYLLNAGPASGANK